MESRSTVLATRSVRAITRVGARNYPAQTLLDRPARLDCGGM